MSERRRTFENFVVKTLWNGRPLNSPCASLYPTDHSNSCNNVFQLIYKQIHADKRAAILKFDTRKTADRKRAIFRRIPTRQIFDVCFFISNFMKSSTVYSASVCTFVRFDTMTWQVWYKLTELKEAFRYIFSLQIVRCPVRDITILFFAQVIAR